MALFTVVTDIMEQSVMQKVTALNPRVLETYLLSNLFCFLVCCFFLVVREVQHCLCFRFVNADVLVIRFW